MKKPDYVLNTPEQSSLQETIDICDRLADRYLDTDLGDSMARTSIALRALQMDTDICPNTYDVVGFMAAYEADQLNADQVAEGFQHLIDSGLVWELQDSYGKIATTLIQAGHCRDTHGHAARKASTMQPLNDWLTENWAQRAWEEMECSEGILSGWMVNGCVFIILDYKNGGWEAFVPIKAPLVEGALKELETACKLLTVD